MILSVTGAEIRIAAKGRAGKDVQIDTKSDQAYWNMLIFFYLQLSLLSADPCFQNIKLCCKTRKPSTAKYFLDHLGCVNWKTADDFSGFESYECLIAVRGDNITSNMIYVHTFGPRGSTIGQNMCHWITMLYFISAFSAFNMFQTTWIM